MFGGTKKKSVNVGRKVASVPYVRNNLNNKSDPQRKKLEKVLAKEEQRSKRHRLKEILMQRYSLKITM